MGLMGKTNKNDITMETINNSQEQNENLDQFHPEFPYQYVLVNVEKGSVTWYESHDGAVRDQAQYGGSIINTKTADPEFVKRVLENARRNM